MCKNTFDQFSVLIHSCQYTLNISLTVILFFNYFVLYTFSHNVKTVDVDANKKLLLLFSILQHDSPDCAVLFTERSVPHLADSACVSCVFAGSRVPGVGSAAGRQAVCSCGDSALPERGCRQCHQDRLRNWYCFSGLFFFFLSLHCRTLLTSAACVLMQVIPARLSRHKTNPDLQRFRE